MKALCTLWNKRRVFCNACLQVSFSDALDLDLDSWDWKTKNLATEVLQKSTFAEVGFLMMPGSVFHDFGLPWDQFSLFLLPWRTGLKFHDFSK